MATTTRIPVGDLTLTRVLYTDALVDPAATGLSAAEIEAVPWNDDRWSADGQTDTSRACFDPPTDGHWSDDVWAELFAAELVGTYRAGTAMLPAMTAEFTGAHNPGHHVFHFGNASSPAATYVGHLAVSPLHLSTGACPQQHLEPDRAWDLLRSFADDGRILLGPLWPSPGAGRWTGTSFVPLDA